MNGLTYRLAPTRVNVWLRLLVVVLLPATTLVLIVHPSFAKGASLLKTTIITGTVEECGAGPSNVVVRTLVIRLHERPNGRVVAIYTVEPSTHIGSYAFSVVPGTYFLTTSASTSVPPPGNIVVRSTSRAVMEVPISTPCQ